MTYNYIESGLDNVILENGYTIHKTPYGDGVSIENVAGLHQAIGRWLVRQRRPLTGAEFRFLRAELELSQLMIAQMLGTGEQAVRRWEKQRKKDIPGMADRLIRGLYKEHVDGDGSMKEIMERLREIDDLQHTTARLREDNDTWRIAA